MPSFKKTNTDYSKTGTTASRYFTNTLPEEKENKKPSESVTPKAKKKKLGRPEKAETEKSQKKPHTVYFEPETEKKMQEYLTEHHIKKSDLIEIALLEYLKNNA